MAFYLNFKPSIIIFNIMDFYFEEDCNFDNTSYVYNIGDVVSFVMCDQGIYIGTIENISPCYHHNIKYIFYTLEESDSGIRFLIEQDKIIKNHSPEILLLEIEYDSKKLLSKNDFQSNEYKDFSFVIW